MSIIVLMVFFGSLFFGIKMWKKNRWISFLCFGPIIIIIAFISYFSYHFIYKTTPDSLQVHVEKENNNFVLNGVWKERLDKFRYPLDFIVFYVPNNEEVLNVKRYRIKERKTEEGEYLLEEVQAYLELEHRSEWKPQIFATNTAKEFHYAFSLPKNVNVDEVDVLYVHIRAEPMDQWEYWYKKINL